MHAIEREGRPPAVVCVHGYCQSAAYWEPTLERLAQFGARGIAVDLPGFAHSANNPGPYTMEGLADALAWFLDGLKLASVVLVGGSMGGVVAQHFALRHPGRVLRLLLVATGAYTADPEGEPHGARTPSPPSSMAFSGERHRSRALRACAELRS